MQTQLADEIKAPGFFTKGFHTRFFPGLLMRLLRPDSGSFSAFSNHIPLEITVITVLSMAATVWGAMKAAYKNSIAGWVIGSLGLVTFLYMLVKSILSERGEKLSYHRFSLSIFASLLLLGPTLGLMFGRLNAGHTTGALLLDMVAGLCISYAPAIAVGLWSQKLGWIRTIFDLLALGALPGMIIISIIMFM